MDDFDPSKEAKNLANHQISLVRWRDMAAAVTVDDDRFDYGEQRFRSYGWIDGLSYCFVFTIRDGRYRPISLRRAHAKEMRRYVPPS